MESSDRRLAQAALLAFGTPLLLLMLSALGTAVFAADQPAWALVGLAPLLGIAAGGHNLFKKALIPLRARPKERSLRQ